MTEWKQKVSQGKAPEYFNIDNIFDADDIFVELVNHPATFPVVRGAIGEDVQLEGASGRIYPPGPTILSLASGYPRLSGSGFR